MGTWLSGIGIFLLVLPLLLLFLLWLRVRYEFRCFRYDTAGASFFVGWAGDLVSAEVRYYTRAGLYWRLKWPFGELDSQRSRSEERAERHAEAEAPEDVPTEESVPQAPQRTQAEAPPGETAATDTDETAADTDETKATDTGKTQAPAAAEEEKSEKPSLTDYLRLVAYAIREGIIGSTVQYIRRVWRRMTPRYAAGEGRLGLGDPYAQGLLLGALYATLPRVAARLDVTFTEEVAEGHLVIGGSVRPLLLCWDTLRFITAAPVRKTGLYYWRQVRK